MTEPIVELLAQEWLRIDELCDSLETRQWLTATDCPGWTVQDQLAHMIGTESMLAGRAAPAVDDAALNVAHVKNEIGARNEAWVVSMRALAPRDVLACWRDIVATRLSQLHSYKPERFDEIGASPVGQVPYREFMNVRLMDCWVHEQDIRRAVGKPGNRTGEIVEQALGRFVPAMGFVVGKKAGAADGTTVVFNLTGDAGRRFTVTVEGGRARVTPGSVTHPTVSLQLETETWWVLALGRQSPSQIGKHAIHIEGDTELAQRILDNLTFMI